MHVHELIVAPPLDPQAAAGQTDALDSAACEQDFLDVTETIQSEFQRRRAAVQTKDDVLGR